MDGLQISGGRTGSGSRRLYGTGLLRIFWNIAINYKFINMPIGRDNLLSDNPCTPVTTDDVGFALFTHDAWYGTNIVSQHKSVDDRYNSIPESLHLC